MPIQHWIQKPPLGVQINWSDPLTKGLVGCWLFNENNGDKVYDLSGHGKTGSIVGTDWGLSPRGPALDNDRATVDYINIGPLTTTGFFSKLSIELYVKCGNIIDSQYFCGVRCPAAGGGFGFSHRGDVAGDPIRFTIFGVVAVTSAGFSATVGTWYHFVVTYDQTSVNFYIDGVLLTSTAQTSAIPITIEDFYLASWNDQGSASSSYHGVIDHMRIYNRALTAQEVLELYLNPHGMFDYPMPWLGAIVVVGNPWYAYAQMQ